MKILEKVSKIYIWLIIVLILTVYFVYNLLSFDGSIEQALTDYTFYVHNALSITLQILMVDGAYDSASSQGLNSEEYQEADKINNAIIKEINNDMKGFRNYIKALNEHELNVVREDFLFAKGCEEPSELKKKDLKAYNKLKGIKHDIYGINLALYYEMTRGGKVSYKASLKKNQGKRFMQVKKALIGVLFGAMTVNMTLSWGNFGDAISKLLVMGSGLVITFVMVYVPQYLKFVKQIPAKVINKYTLFEGYQEFKKGGIELKATITEEVPTEEVEELAELEAIKKLAELAE